jgi:hypothetical protein
MRQLTAATLKEVGLIQMQGGKMFLFLGEKGSMGFKLAKDGTFKIGGQTYYPARLIATAGCTLAVSHEKPKKRLTEPSYAIALRNNITCPDDAVNHLLERHLNG